MSGAVVGTANNSGAQEGIRGRVVGSDISDEELAAMQQQILGQLNGSDSAMDRFRA